MFHFIQTVISTKSYPFVDIQTKTIALQHTLPLQVNKNIINKNEKQTYKNQIDINSH